MKRIFWRIYKKTVGEPWPGEAWDYAKNKYDALRQFRDGTYDYENFRIVRETLESVKEAK